MFIITMKILYQYCGGYKHSDMAMG